MQVEPITVRKNAITNSPNVFVMIFAAISTTSKHHQMKHQSYIAVFVLLVLANALVVAAYYFVAQDIPLSTIVWQKTVLISLLLIALKAVAQFIYFIFTLHVSRLQYDTSIFPSFVLPIFEEIVTYIIVKKWLQNHYQIMITIAVVNTFYLILRLLNLDTWNYMARYETFLQFYDMFSVNPQINKLSFTRDSVSSETTLKADGSKLSSKFSFEDLPKSCTSKSLPVKITNHKSNHCLLDTLYSVSPKNTYHLNTATAIATVHIIDKEDNCQNHSWYGSIDEVSLEEAVKSDLIGPYEAVAVPASSRNSSGNSACNETGFSFKRFVDWWFWICPSLWESKKSSCEKNPLLHHKLSMYSLDSGSSRKDSIISRRSCWTLTDLEAGILDLDTNNQHPYIKFVEFVTKFCDYRHKMPMEIDPTFVRFGVLTIDCHWIWLLLDLINLVFWNTLVLLTFDKFGTISLLILITIRLFQRNYLENPFVNLNYKLVIASKTIVYVSVFVVFILAALT